MSVQQQVTLVSTIMYMVRFTGLWNTGTECIKNPLVVFALFCYFGTYVLQTVALVLYKNNIELEFEIFSVISFCGMGILKLQSLYINRNQWLSLLNKMKELETYQMNGDAKLSDEEYESENESDDVVNIITNSTKKYKRAASILSKIYCFTGVVFILSPFIEYAFAMAGGKSAKYPHILPSWNPFDSIHFLCYLAVIVCEIVAAAYCVCVHIAFDATVIGAMIFICGLFSSLVHLSTRIGGRGKICSLSERRDARAHSRIIKCHKIHVELVRCITELDGLLKNIIGFYFLLATLTLCTVAVRLKTEQMGAMQLVSLLQYMCATITQLYIYCSYGDAVYDKSSISVTQGPFGAAVWCVSPKIRREICMLGIGMMKQRRLHAGPFNTVDLPSFIQIIRAAYSYYAVLGGTTDDNTSTNTSQENLRFT